MSNFMKESSIARTSVTAIFSLACSLSFFIGIPIVGSVAGIILGRNAKKEIMQSEGQLAGEGIASAGVTIGWFGLFVWLMGLLCGALAAVTGLLGTMMPFILRFLLQFGFSI